MAFYITHIIIQPYPSKGLRKVAFYTINSENPKSEEYFLGTDNNPFQSNYLEELIIDKKIFRTSKEIIILDSETLYVDSIGNYYLAHYLDNSENRKLIIKCKTHTNTSLEQELTLFGNSLTNSNFLSLSI